MINDYLKLRLQQIGLHRTKQQMTENKGMQMIDKMTRHHIFNSRYWKQQCFALNAQTFIDKAVEIKYIGGLYSGTKKPTKFLCLVFKLLQMNLPKQIAIQYLKARDYKYLNAISLFYLRLILKGSQAYQKLEPFLNDNRKLRIRNLVGQFSIIYIDEFIDNILREQTFMGISLPFLTKRLALEEQGFLKPRVSILQEQQEQNDHQNDQKDDN